jgi:drug/metabolite transporter (DMT)-like permease
VPISAGFLVWVGIAFVAAACWGATVILNKEVLADVAPVAVNFFVVAVSTATLAAVAVPMSLLHLWPLGLGLTWRATGYLCISAPVMWLVAFNAYFYALRSGRVGVVGPLSTTDPLFTALFATVILGAALGRFLIAGLIVTVCGVMLISRWMDAEPGDGLLEAVVAPTGIGAGGGAPGGGAAAATAATAAAVTAGTGTVVGLSLLTAAGWGFSPVLVQLAERSTGGATTTLVLLGEALGVALLAPFVIAQRGRLFTPGSGARRGRIALLLAGAGVLNAVFSVLYYVLIAQIGPVLTMLITASAPVFAIAGGVLFLHERFGRRLALGVAVTLTGVLLATLQHVR